MSTPSLDSQLRQIGQLQPHLPPGTSLLLGVAALGAVTLPGIWPMVRHVTQIPHEGAHAVMGSSLGHKITGMTFSRGFEAGTNIPTLSRARSEEFLTVLVGYLGPSAVGLGAAKLIADGHIIAVLWLSLLGVVLVMPLLRSAYSWFCILATAALLYLVARYAAAGAQIAIAYGIAWFMLVGGPRVVMLRGLASDDVGRLRQLTFIHRRFWSLLWLAGTMAAFAVGFILLV